MPSRLVVTVITAPAEGVTRTVAFATAAPEGSVTWPRKVPWEVCACDDRNAASSRINIRTMNFGPGANFIKSPTTLCAYDVREAYGVAGSPPPALRLHGERMD